MHDHGESQCITLFEHRVRIVCGGVNGSLSMVDPRANRSIAELPTHPDEVTCLTVDWPTGRALASGSQNGDAEVWDSRILLQLDGLLGTQSPTRQ